MSSKDKNGDDRESKSTIGHEVIMSPAPEDIDAIEARNETGGSVKLQDTERLSSKFSNTSSEFEDSTLLSRGQISTNGSFSSYGSGYSKKSKSSGKFKQDEEWGRTGEKRESLKKRLTIDEVGKEKREKRESLKKRKGEKGEKEGEEEENDEGKRGEKRETVKRKRKGEDEEDYLDTKGDRSIEKRKRKSGQSSEKSEDIRNSESEESFKSGDRDGSQEDRGGTESEKDDENDESSVDNRTQDSESDKAGRSSSQRWILAIHKVRISIRSKESSYKVRGKSRLSQDWKDEMKTESKRTDDRGRHQMDGRGRYHMDEATKTDRKLHGVASTTKESDDKLHDLRDDPLRDIIKRTGVAEKEARKSEVLAVNLPVVGKRDAVGQYLTEHKIGELFNTFLMALLRARPDKPVDFLHNMARDLNRQRKDVKTAESVACPCADLVKATATVDESEVDQ